LGFLARKTGAHLRLSSSTLVSGVSRLLLLLLLVLVVV